jgi:hypothetical protein
MRVDWAAQGKKRQLVIRRHTILLASAALLAATSAAAGSLEVWENSRGAPGVTAHFPTGPAQQARIFYDASSAETGGLLFGASDIEFQAKGSIDFVDFDCHFQGCNPNDYVFDPGTESTTPRPGRLSVSDPDTEPRSGIYDIGTLTFDAPQQPGNVLLFQCYYTDLAGHEHTCNQFVVVQLPEPCRATSLLAGAVLLFGTLRPRRRASRRAFRKGR